MKLGMIVTQTDPETVFNALRLAFALKTPWAGGTTHLLLCPMELIEKLAPLVPPPRLNLVRYHRALAPKITESA